MCSWVGRINLIKTSIPRTAMYRLNQMPINIPMVYFTKNRTHNSKHYIEPKQKKRITSAILRKKNKVGGIMLPDIKLYYKAIIIKRARHWHKNNI